MRYRVNTDHRNETRTSGMGDLALIAETTVSPRITSCLVGSLIRSADPGSKCGRPVAGRMLRCWLGVRLTFSLLLVGLAALALAQLRVFRSAWGKTRQQAYSA